MTSLVKDDKNSATDLVDENARLKREVLEARVQAAKAHLELLQQRRTSLTIEANLIDQKLLPDAQETLRNLLLELDDPGKKSVKE